MMIIFYILELLFTIILFLTFVLLSLWVLGHLVSKSHFRETPTFLLEKIYKILQVKDSSVVYNLGCGDGRVLFYLLEKNKKAEYLGTEENPYLFLVVKLKNLWARIRNKKEVKILYKNLFKQDLSQATHLFLYLYPNIMDDLLPKLEKELKQGAFLVSLNFKFTQKRYSQKFEILNEKGKITHKIYVYEF